MRQAVVLPKNILPRGLGDGNTYTCITICPMCFGVVGPETDYNEQENKHQRPRTWGEGVRLDRGFPLMGVILIF